MAVRPIDAVQVLKDINRHHKPTPVSEFESGFNQGLNQAMWIITHAPTLTPPNEWVSVEEKLPDEELKRFKELFPEENEVEVLVMIQGAYTATTLYWDGERFYDEARSYKVTHWMPLPAPPGKDNNVPAKTPNEPLTQEDIDKMHFDRVWIDYGLDDSGERCGEDGVILYGKLYSIDTLDGSAFEDLLLNACDGETLGRPSGDYTVYRRPPEGGEENI